MAFPRITVLAVLLLGFTTFASSAQSEESEATHTHAADHAHGSETAGGEGHAEHHVPTWDDVNWFFGFLGEKEGVEPDLLWRAPGMPVPVGVQILNTAVLFFLAYRFGKGPVQKALKERRAGIVKGIEEASAMKAQAEASLAEYEGKLQQIEVQIERVRREMREMGEAERGRILNEARERQVRMEREARVLVDQEIKAARQLLHQQVVENAFKSALETLQQRVTSEDHQRLGQAYLATVGEGPASFSKGGRA